MRVAILLRGITYKYEFVSSAGIKQSINYEISRDNIKKNIIEAYDNPDVYITTYNSVKKDEIIDFFKPKDYIFADENSASNNCIGGEISSLINGLKLIDKEKYDSMVVSRNDILYNNTIKDLDIQYNKVNFLFREESPVLFERQGRCGNVLWIIPSNFLDDFIAAATKINEMDNETFNTLNTNLGGYNGSMNRNQMTHFIHHELVKIIPNDIHFIFHGYSSSDAGAGIYKIVRNWL